MEAVVRTCNWCPPMEDSSLVAEYLVVAGCLEELHVRVYYLCRKHHGTVMALLSRAELYCHGFDPATPGYGYSRVAEIIAVRCDEQGKILPGEKAEIVTAPAPAPPDSSWVVSADMARIVSEDMTRLLSSRVMFP